VFALIDINKGFWEMMFFVMVFIVGASVVYPLGTLHFARTFDEKSQSLAGGLYNVSQQVGMALGLGVTFSVSGAVSKSYNRAHPDLAADDPGVLMAGFRVAAWALAAACGLAIIISLIFLRGWGAVGKPNGSSLERSNLSPAIGGIEEKNMDNIEGAGDIEIPVASRFSTASRPDVAILRS
jgi:hypothetical protein